MNIDIDWSNVTWGIGLDIFFAKKSGIFDTLDFIVPAVTTSLTPAFRRATIVSKGEATTTGFWVNFSVLSGLKGVFGMSY